MNLRNAFFKTALDQATRMVGHPARLAKVLTQLALKMRRVDWNHVTVSSVRDHFYTIGRLLRAHLTGAYRVRSLKMIIVLLAAVIYFLNPVDFVPDFIVGAGLVDDFAVLTWVHSAAMEELEIFSAWEAEQTVRI